MAAAAIRYAARRIGGHALQPTQAAAAVTEVQQSILPRLFHSGKPVYSPRVSPFSNTGPRRSSNAKVLATDMGKCSHRQEKLVEYTKNAMSVGITFTVLIALFGYPGERRKMDPSLQS